MADIRMGPAETQFAEIIWENEPIASGVLAKKAEEILSWKKTTSFTVLKRLCERGIFQNQNGTVTSLISKEEFFARHSEAYVQDTFGGSLPAFMAAFSTRKKLTDKEIDEMKNLIEKMRG
jgi:predicted transcriptional regulator